MTIRRSDRRAMTGLMAPGLLLAAAFIDGEGICLAQGTVAPRTGSSTPVPPATVNPISTLPATPGGNPLSAPRLLGAPAASSAPLPVVSPRPVSPPVLAAPPSTNGASVAGRPAILPAAGTAAAVPIPVPGAPIPPAPSPAAGPAGAPPAATPPANGVPSAPPAAAPFVSLYNGRDLDGWEIHDGKLECWKGDGETLSCIAPGGGWLRTKTLYSDFVLRFEYRLSAGANTGVAFRFPSEGNPASNGFEVQLIDDAAPKYQGISPTQHTGSLYYLVPPQVPVVAHPAGAWNACQVLARGSRVEIQVNGQVVNSVQLDDPALNVAGKTSRKPVDQHSPLGHLGLQSYSTRVDFRKIEVLDLTAATPGGVRYVDLVPGNGESLPADATVTVNFRGQLADGKSFIDRRDRAQPVTVPLNQTIAGWKEGLAGMRAGGRRRLIVPPAMAYGEKGFPSLVPPNATLIYDVDLLGFQPPVPNTAQRPPAPSSPAGPAVR